MATQQWRWSRCRSTRTTSTLLLLLALAAAAADTASASRRRPTSAADTPTVAGAPWSPASFPNPNLDPAACGRPGVARSAVCDPDGLLSKQGGDVIEGLIAEIRHGDEPYARVRCGRQGMRGFQIGVALMTSMVVEEAGEAAGEEAAAAFARALHEAWGVGDAACDNGLLLLLSAADRQAYVSTGAGAARAVGTPQLRVVLANMRPQLRAGDYDGAVRDGLHQLGLALAGADVPAESDDDNGDGLFVFFFFLAIVAAVMLWGWYSARRQRKRYAACAAKLERIKREQEAVRRAGGGGAGTAYAATSCPICLEDFDGGGVVSAAAGGGSGSAPSAPPIPAAGASASASAPPLPGAASSSAAGERDALLAGATAASPPRAGAPLTLRCGHSFCAGCITEWATGGHTNCPICRRDIDDDAAGDGTAAAAPGACAAAAATGTAAAAAAAAARRRPDAAEALWYPELGFRLASLRRQYPGYVTDPLLLDWQSDIMAGRALDTGRLAASAAGYLRHSASARHELAQSGRHGARDGFGGGGWSGGGGGGGGGAGSSW